MRIIEGHAKDLGGFSVRRILPTIECRSLGPFVFFDEMGPLTLKTGLELEVRPHPHIGLATMTWLFAGAMMHRDSLGSVQVIHPGAVNLMTAGRGIVHSERVSQSGMTPGVPGNDVIHGAQFWLALPKSHEACEPAFAHHPAETLPAFTAPGVQGRVVMGAYSAAAGTYRSPVMFPAVSAPHPTLCLDLTMEPGAELTLPADPAIPERGVYPVAGAVTVNGARVDAHTLGVPPAGASIVLTASPAGARLLVIGGAPLDGPRHLDWNFVASDPARLDAAKAEWRTFDPSRGTARFPQVPGETEFIPLP
jgi:redox-sensitive bicupin YhaK (pirin superfamily)